MYTIMHGYVRTSIGNLIEKWGNSTTYKVAHVESEIQIGYKHCHLCFRRFKCNQSLPFFKKLFLFNKMETNGKNALMNFSHFYH